MNTQDTLREKIGTVGIIGGLGPFAGAFFYERLVCLTPARADQEHLKVLLYADPAVPSRVDHLLHNGANPGPILQKVAQQLEGWGADILAIPSATTHAYYHYISEAVSIPTLHLLKEVGEELYRQKYQCPAFVATAATAALRLFDPHLPEGIKPVYPDIDTQREIQLLIDAVKAGEELELLRASLGEILSRPWIHQADCVVLACTEVPLISPQGASPLPTVSITDVLARSVIKYCFRGAYENIHSPF